MRCTILAAVVLAVAAAGPVEAQGANGDAQRLAQEGRVTWPLEIDPHRQIEQELSTLDGRAFDRRFVEAMVEDHEALASLLRNQSDAAAPVAPVARASPARR
jgi:uncharacterized protein (DUF305 family)